VHPHAVPDPDVVLDHGQGTDADVVPDLVRLPDVDLVPVWKSSPILFPA